MTDQAPDPLFIVGTGRCGSTILHDLVCLHPDVSYLSKVLTRFPRGYDLNRWAVRSRQALGTRLDRFAGASEVWPFWEDHRPGFARPVRDLQAGDILPRNAEEIRDALTQVRPSPEDPLVVKFTGWTRVGWIKEVFPDSRIVHLVRDPRGFAHSVLHVGFWDGWRGPAQWRWGRLTDAEAKIWERSDRSFATLAAIQWTRILESYWESHDRLSSEDRQDVRTLSYSDFCHRTDEVLDEILSTIGVGDSRRFQRRRDRIEVEDRNHKWRQGLTDRQADDLVAALDDLGWKKLMPAGKHDPGSGP